MHFIILSYYGNFLNKNRGISLLLWEFFALKLSHFYMWHRWSLLEKYSCKASKLHLKPRRFKIFLEALVSKGYLYLFGFFFNVLCMCWSWSTFFVAKEHQLLKDRKKNVRKRPLQGGNCLPAAPTAVSNQSRASGNDAYAVKLVLVDSQNILKLGPSKPSTKRNVNMGVNRSNTKGDSNTMKPTRQRKKSGDSFSIPFKISFTSFLLWTSFSSW